MPSDALSHARKAVAVWISLPLEDPIVGEIARAFERAAPCMAQCLYTGYGSVEIKFRDKRLVGVEWRQGLLFS